MQNFNDDSEALIHVRSIGNAGAMLLNFVATDDDILNAGRAFVQKLP